MKGFWLSFIWANWIAIISFWISGSGDMLSAGAFGILVALGRFAGLAAAYTVLLQVLYMSRLPLIEGAFGLDTLSRMHRSNGLLAPLFIVLHPILLAIGYSSGQGAWAQFLDFTAHRDVFFALIGAALLVLIVFVSLYIIRSRVKYESWYSVHLLAYLGIFFAFGHQLEIGTDFANKAFYGYWVALYAVVFLCLLVFRVLRPIVNFVRHKFVVKEVIRESDDVVSILISGRDLERFKISPGQFLIFRFLGKGMWWQAHPFSMSTYPNGENIRITVRELGDFTRSLQGLKLGTRVVVDGPYGIFTEKVMSGDKALLIAGGIGITPIRPLAEDLIKKGKDVAVVYSNRNPGNTPLKKELDEIAAQGGKVFYVFSEGVEDAALKGYVDEEKIKNLVPDFSSRDAYICGPPPMMDAVIKTLQKLGVPKRKIHFEKFSFA